MRRAGLSMLFLLWMSSESANACQVGDQQQSLIQNGSFAEWNDGLPVNWKISVGATNDDNNVIKSIVKKAEGPSLQLSGNGKTSVWNYVSQTIPIEGNKTYALTLSARASKLKREGRQFDNCYAGVVLKNSRGQTMQQEIASFPNQDYTKIVLPFRTSKDMSEAQVAIFLSKTGRLNVKDLALQELTLNDSFEVLVTDMDRNYSFFEHKNIDWKILTDKYRERATAADSPEQFNDVVAEMLAEMNDMHTWIMHDGKQISKSRSSFDANFDFAIVDRDLQSKKRIGNFGIVGKTSDGFGYVRITSLAGIEQREKDLMVRELRKLFDAKGMIVDLRRNGGGSEFVAGEIAGMFVKNEQIYARNRFRAGPKHDQFFESQPRKLRQSKGPKYLKPIVCMIGPGAVSSAEGFAMMMQAIDHCTTIGQPTRGASGNPQPVQLADGIDVFYSRWMSLTPDGTPIEDVGVQPDEIVGHQRGSDKTYERAKQILADKT